VESKTSKNDSSVSIARLEKYGARRLSHLPAHGVGTLATALGAVDLKYRLISARDTV
jgi:hypothetical protein